MTVSSQTSSVSYLGDGSTTLLPVPYYFLEQTDLVVTRVNADTSTTTLILGSDFSVSGAGVQAGGAVTMFVAPVVGVQILITRVVPVTQETDYVENDPFPAESHERALDKLTMIAQQGSARLDRALLMPIGKNFYDAIGRRIVNLSDPVDLQDAATRNYVEQYIGSIIADGSGPSNFAANVLYTDVVGVVRNLQQLSNITNTALGAGMIGRATRHVETMAELLLTPGRYTNDMVYMERLDAAHDGGGGGMIWLSTSTTTANNITVFQVTGVPVGRWLRVYDDLEAGMFGARPVTGFNNTTAFASIESFLRAELAAFRKLPTVWLNAGTYESSLAPNWGIQGAMILNRGKVKIRGTGTGSVMILDAGAAFGTNLTELTIGTGSGFIFENGPTATSPTVFVQNVYLSEIRGRVWGAGLAQAGWSILGCVLSKFWIASTPTESSKETPADYINGWYLGGKPVSGKTVSQSAANAQSAYNIFYNWLGAACVFGMFIDSTLGNVWIGGDNEFCTDTGAVITALAFGNRTYGLNGEVNTTSDLTCSGSFNEMSMDSAKFFFAGGSGNKLIGGMHDQITISGGTGNFVGGVIYGRGLSGNLVIADSGTRSAFGWCYQAQSQKWSLGPSTTGTITVGASPFTFTNNTNRTLIVGVSGGTVSNTTYFRGALNLGATAGGGSWHVSPGDALSVTFSGLPTMNFASA